MTDTALHVAVHNLNQECNTQRYPAIIINQRYLVPLFEPYQAPNTEKILPYATPIFTIGESLSNDVVRVLLYGFDLNSNPSVKQVIESDIRVNTTKHGLDIVPIKSVTDYYSLLNGKQLAENTRLRLYVKEMADFTKDNSDVVTVPFDYDSTLNKLYELYLGKSFTHYYRLPSYDYEFSPVEQEEAIDGKS